MPSALSARLPSPAAIMAAMFVVALATILGAWGFELIGGFVPCKLCLQERIPYYAGIALLLGALVTELAGAPSALGRLLLAGAGLVFLIGAGLGVYHAGVEWGWWLGPSDCGTGGGGGPATAADLLNRIENIRVVSCTEAGWRFPAGWGLSFAGWNAVIAGVLAATGLAGALAPRQGSSSVSQ